MCVGGPIYPGRVQQSLRYITIFHFSLKMEMIFDKKSRRVTLGGLELETEHQVTMLADAHHLYSRWGIMLIRVKKK
jgi:hypothetical protein